MRILQEYKDPEPYTPRLIALQATSWELVTSTVTPSLKDVLIEVQKRDAFLITTLRELEVSGYSISNRSGWQINSERLLRHRDAVYVPKDSAIRQVLLRNHHDDPTAGHFAARKMQELMERKYYWESMRKDVEDYTGTCLVC